MPCYRVNDPYVLVKPIHKARCADLQRSSDLLLRAQHGIDIHLEHAYRDSVPPDGSQAFQDLFGNSVRGVTVIDA